MELMMVDPSFLGVFASSLLLAVGAGRIFFWYCRGSPWLQALRRNLNTPAGASGVAVSALLAVLALLLIIPPPLGLAALACVSLASLPLLLLYLGRAAAKFGGGLLFLSLPGLALTLTSPLLLPFGPFAPLLFALLGLGSLLPAAVVIGLLLARLESNAEGDLGRGGLSPR